jgi:hypothetical protein
MDHFEDPSQVDGTFLRRQPIDTIKFFGPIHATIDKVPFVMSYMSY